MSSRSWSRRWSRLLTLSPDEIKVRCAQEIRKRFDHWQGRLGGRVLAPSCPDARFGSGRFFFDIEERGAIEACLRDLPHFAAGLVERAERICEHRFSLLGYSDLDFGTPIDWHRDAVSSKRAPLKPWYKIRFLDFAEVGDVKVTWELNRHQHLVTLAKAYCLTGDRRFLEEATAQWYSWREQNPYPIGVNWASSLEVAFRALSWTWIWQLLADRAAVNTQYLADLERGVALSARHVERYLSTYFSPNTHLLGEGLALFVAGLLCRAKQAARWRKQGWDIVLAHADNKVQDDGFYFEQSTYYHVYAFDMFLHARLLAERNNIPVPRRFDATLQKMLNALCTLSGSGQVARFGDDDGGRLFDGQRNRPECLLDPLATGAVLFRRPDFKALKPELVEETIWLLGPDAANAFAALPSKQQIGSAAALPNAGLYAMVEGEGETPLTQLTMDAGMQGARGGAHSHADALSIQLSSAGEELLSDAGTYVYVGDEDERRYFRGTQAHNTVEVDGKDQMEALGPFPWATAAAVTVDSWIEGQDFTLLSAHHGGYLRLQDPVTHYRTVFHCKGLFWFVFDLVNGAQSHDVNIRWRLAPGMRWQLKEAAALGCEPIDGRMIGLIYPKSELWSVHTDVEPHSSVYGKREEAEVLRFSRSGQLPTAFASILHCSAAALGDQAILTALHEETPDCTLRAYRFDHAQSNHCIFVSQPRRDWQWKTLASDAEFLYHGQEYSGRQYLVACGASYIRIEGSRLFYSDSPAKYWEWSSAREGDQRADYIPDQNALAKLNALFSRERSSVSRT